MALRGTAAARSLAGGLWGGGAWGGRGRALSGAKETVMGKHNLLLEGLAKKGGGGGGGSGRSLKSIDSQIQDRIRGTEAAYFFSEDHYSMAKMRGEDVKRGTMVEIHKPNQETDALASVHALIEEEFAEFKDKEVPEQVRLRVEGVKQKIVDVLRRTNFENHQPSELAPEMREQIRDIDRRLIRQMKAMEIGEKPEELPEGHERSGEQTRLVDVVAAGGLVVLLGGLYFTYKIATDERHLKEARRVAPSLVGAIESTGLIPKA